MNQETPLSGIRRYLQPRGLLRSWLAPILAFLLVRGAIAIAASSTGHAPFNFDVWKRWDSVHYLSIAQTGYELLECSAIAYAPTGWCGNTGWLPGYPFLIRAVMNLGLSALRTGAVLSALFHLFTLALLWNGFLGRKASLQNLLILLAAAFFPGRIYYHAIFPISMFTFFSLLCLVLLLQERWLWSGLAGAVAAFTYPTGLVLAPVIGLWSLLTPNKPLRKRLARALLTAGLVALGFLAVFVVHHLAVGRWDAFFMVQARYGHGLHDPLGTVVQAIQPLFEKDWNDGARAFPALQTLIVLVVVWFQVLRRGNTTGSGYDRQECLLSIFSMALWGFPLLIGGAVSLCRNESVLLPIVLLLPKLSWRVQLLLVVLFVLLSVEIDKLFFRSILV